MKTSRAAIFHGSGRALTLENVSIPALKEGEILVRNEFTTLCRSDLNTFSGKRTEPTPTILGHETVGCIESFGPGAPDHDCCGQALAVGDRLTWAIYAASSDNWLARLGIPQKGPGLFKYGHELITQESHLHGGLAEHCVLRRHTPVLKLTREIPLPAAALINCAVATVAGSLRLAGSVSGGNLIVAGAGMLGLVACAMGRVAGAEKIIALDIDDSRLATSREFGADTAVNIQSPGKVSSGEIHRLLKPERPTFALDFSGVPETMEILLDALPVGGVAVLVGATFPARPLSIDAERLVRRLITIKGLHNYNQDDLIAAVRFIEFHHARFPFTKLVGATFTLDSVNEAFAHAIQSRVHRIGIALSTNDHG
jgi:alcohol dehydrogenase